MRGTVPIVTLALVAAATLNVASTARAADVSVLVVPRFPLERYAGEGAVGLLVPGSGARVSRAGALASLRKGKLRSSKLGGLPVGDDLIRIGGTPAAITVYVSLPPAGTHPNRTRYPIAIVGGGYHGILTASTRRIDGLLSVADVAPTAVALRDGGDPTIRSHADDDAVAALERLDRRLDRLHASRLAANTMVYTAGFTLAALGFFARSRLLVRAGLLSTPLVLLGALTLSSLGESRAAVTWPVLGAVALAALPLARWIRGRRLGLALAAVLAVYLLVLVAWPDVPALSALGPHPDGGGRFYGITNGVETLLLVPALVGAALLGPAGLVGVGLLAIVTVGWSRAGADGGGILVLAAGLGVLALRSRGRELTPRRLALLAGAAVALGLAIVAVDALTGGSSHVTHAVGSGPGALVDDWLTRLELSYRSVTSSGQTTVLWLAAVAGLAAVARARPRSPVLEAFLVAIVVSLLFNDSPNDVARLGVLSAVTLFAWSRVDAASSQRV